MQLNKPSGHPTASVASSSRGNAKVYNTIELNFSELSK